MSTVLTAPDLGTVLGAWRPAPVADVLVLAAVAAYAVLARRARPWPWSRSLAGAGAVVVLVVALDGPVAVFGDVLFWAHMIQHLLLIMVVPVLVIWAEPVRLVRSVWGSPAGWDRVLGSRAARALTAPMLALAVYAAVVVLTHLTGFQQVAALDDGVRTVENLVYLVSGYLLFLPLVGAETGPWSGGRALPHLLRLGVLGLAMGVDTLVGIALMLSRTPLAPAYEAAHPGWGPTALADQNVAGAVMWWGGDAIMMILMIIAGIRWGAAAEAEQGLGTWIEGARRGTVLDGAGGDDDTDSDAALSAYNARLAALHGHPTPAPDGVNGTLTAPDALKVPFTPGAGAARGNP